MPIKLLSNKPKTLSKSPILTTASSPKGTTQANSHTLLIDKLSLVLIPATEEHAEMIHSNIWIQVEDQEVFQSTRKMPGYSLVKLIAVDGHVDRPLLQYAHEAGKAKKIRIEFNPARLGAEGLMKLHAVLISLVPDGWGYFIKHAKITRIDIAIDLLGVLIDQFLLLSSHGQSSRQWARDGHLETFTIGKDTGNQTLIYDKAKEQLAKKKAWTGTSIVRIERRLRQPGAKKLSELAALENPFASLVLTPKLPLRPLNEKETVWAMFLDSAQVRGVNQALALLPTERRTRYRKHLKNNQEPWWDPAAIWTKWPEILAELKLISYNSFH
jgi:hypothetical protein